MNINRTQLVLIFINIPHQIVNFYLSLHNKMGYPNVFPVVITLLFLMSMHANEAGRILLGGEKELMNKNSINQRAFVGGNNMVSLQGMLPRGPITPSSPNPGTHIPASTINERAFAGYYVDSIQGPLARGTVPPSGPNPPTHIPSSTIGQKAFGGHNMARFKSSLARGTVPPSGPNPPTHIPSSSTTNSGTHNIPASTISGRAFAGHHFMAHLQVTKKGSCHSI